MGNPSKRPNSRPMDAALSYLSASMRTVREMECYLDQKQYGEYEIAQVIDRLKELGYLDDEAYARAFIQSRIRTKPVSRRKLRAQLMQHALPSDIVKSTLQDEIDDETERAHAVRTAEKYAPQFEGLSPAECKERLIRRLINRGFTLEDTLYAVRATAPFENDDA